MDKNTLKLEKYGEGVRDVITFLSYKLGDYGRVDFEKACFKAVEMLEGLEEEIWQIEKAKEEE